MSLHLLAQTIAVGQVEHVPVAWISLHVRIYLINKLMMRTYIHRNTSTMGIEET